MLRSSPSPDPLGPLLLSAAVVLVLQACGGDSSAVPAWSGQIDTLPNGVVQVTNPARGIWSDEKTWVLEPDLRIGSMDSEGPELLGQVGEVTASPDGTIYVIENQSHELRVFDASGAHVRTMGGEGQGPGELNVSFGGEVFLAEDVILVNNMMNRRWEAFSYEGEPLGSTPSPTQFLGMGTVMGRDGALYARSMIFSDDAMRDRTPILIRMQLDGFSLVVQDTIMAARQREPETIEASFSANGNQMVVALPVPFVHQPSWVLDPAGFIWADEGDGYVLHQRDLDGNTLRTIGRDYDPVPVTEDDLSGALEQFSEGPLANAGIDVDRSRIPDSHPPILSFQTDAVGNLWVRRSLGGDTVSWDVFDPEGRYLGPVSSGVDLGKLTVHQITDRFIYGVLLDEFDVPYVVRLRIRKGPAEEGTTQP